MLDRKPQTKYVPLRIRFRSATELSPSERELAPQGDAQSIEPLVPDFTDISEAQRRTQQIKELLRLSTLLRADLGLPRILQQFAASIAACTGFRVLAINLIDEKTNTIAGVAFAGLSEEDQRTLQNSRDPVEKLSRLMRPEFRISQSYFISHEHADVASGSTVVVSMTMKDYEPGGWHPEDMLLSPLFSPRERKMLGFLAFDDPEDGKVPTQESIEIAELFANQAAIAIDNARLFQEREDERLALEQGISVLREDLEPLRRGHLYARVRAVHPRLLPIADAINTVVREISTILKNMHMVTQAVDEHTRNVQRNSELLVRDTSQQERQVHQISHVISEIAEMMHHVSGHANALSETADDAVEVTHEAQGAVDRAVEGMGVVREATMHSARTMKSLGESGQEINETVMAITDLSIRMHLLALNAAIEVTRAGEHGQGFAIIVKEMRALATTCTEAARKIGTYIRTFQQETSAVSHSVEQSTQQVVLQTELVTQTGVALEAISAVTEQLTTLIKGVCTTAESQEHGSQLVVSAVGEILRMTEDITLRMREMQQSMTHMVELTNSLRARMAAFHFGEQ